MPRFDGTGPKGMGPNTGIGQGFCSKSSRNFVSRDISLEEQKKILEKELDNVKTDLELVEKKIKEKNN